MQVNTGHSDEVGGVSSVQKNQQESPNQIYLDT